MLTWQELTRLPPDELERTDIAVRNLACAHGLPGAENIDVDLCLRTLDRWTQQAGEQLTQSEIQFRRRPEDFNNSWALFRITDMVTVNDAVNGLSNQLRTLEGVNSPEAHAAREAALEAIRRVEAAMTLSVTFRQLESPEDPNLEANTGNSPLEIWYGSVRDCTFRENLCSPC